MISKKKSRYYISLQEATKFCNYSQEYLSLLARQGKLKAKKIDRNWVTTEDWLKEYLLKAEEYNNHLKVARSTMSEPSAVRDGFLMREPPENLPAGEFTLPKVDLIEEGFWVRKKAIIAAVIMTCSLAAGSLLGMKNFDKVIDKEILVGPVSVRTGDVLGYAADVFKDYADWLEEKTGFSVFKEEFFAFGKWAGGEISEFQRFVFNKIPPLSWPFLTKQDLVEVEEKQTSDIIEKFQEGISELKGLISPKEIVKKETVKETTREIIKMDEEALKEIRRQISSLEEEMQKRLYAPGGVITQQIYVTEPVQSPKIYQENGEIVLQTLGSGNVIISAATGLQLYGKQVVIESTSLLSPLIYLASNTRIDGNLTVTGSITGGALSVSSIAASGNATVGGNLTVSGDLTISGAQTYSGAATFTASSTSPVLTVTQNGSGLVAKFMNGAGTSLFTIDNDGSITANATITAASFTSAADDSTVRKSGEEVFREIMPIGRYDIPAQTGTNNYLRISKSFDQNPLASTPTQLPGSTRVYKLIIKYNDNIPTNSSSSWRIYRPAADTTSDSFILLGRNSSSASEGEATTTQNLTIPDTDWQVDVKLSTADAGKTLRVFQIFLAAFDKIN